MDKGQVLDCVKKLDNYLIANNWKAYDPFDGLSFAGSDLLTKKNHYLRIALQQAIRRFPLNLRPALGIKKVCSSKGMGYCGKGYLLLYKSTKKTAYFIKFQSCMDWLINNSNKDYGGYCWGNHFSYESRHGTIPKGMPTIVWTSLIANVFLDAYEILDEPKYLDVAKSCGDFIIQNIGRFQVSNDQLCFMYTPPVNGQKPSWNGCIHNSNVLGAWLLARLYKHTGNSNMLNLARKAMEFTVSHQKSDGSWYYGEPKKYHWIDSFHTGYVLEAIHGYHQASGKPVFQEALQKGYNYFSHTFFDQSGCPRYYSHKTYPIDIQCASQGIQTLVLLSQHKNGSKALAKKVLQWTIKNMQDAEGYFYYRKYPFITNKTPTFHWGQATMLSALGHLYDALTVA